MPTALKVPAMASGITSSRSHPVSHRKKIAMTKMERLSGRLMSVKAAMVEVLNQLGTRLLEINSVGLTVIKGRSLPLHRLWSLVHRYWNVDKRSMVVELN